jgi:hypothetical protein
MLTLRRLTIGALVFGVAGVGHAQTSEAKREARLPTFLAHHVWHL